MRPYASPNQRLMNLCCFDVSVTTAARRTVDHNPMVFAFTGLEYTELLGPPITDHCHQQAVG
ncbi:hypothetical protein QWZ16_24565 [Vibrio ostreicida]|uniref:Uncharacterized protein n=1 Tax=Vibrio ostreicida TaxID=526588 RepID=A0ABT8C308_9VIBR|nr:hypothetical protein [Vibrio ostreicida]MDN3612742.1 hypothetical protein [Vibrio ostreicida]